MYYVYLVKVCYFTQVIYVNSSVLNKFAGNGQSITSVRQFSQLSFFVAYLFINFTKLKYHFYCFFDDR